MTKLTFSIALGWTVCAVVVSASGCGFGGGDAYHRQAVKGTVNLDGEPLSAGSIVFVPDPEGPVVSGARVQEGTFLIPQEQGLPTGNYKVSITASAIEGAPMEDVDELISNPPSAKSLIPPKYNVQTTLRSEVKEMAENVFVFDLKSK